MVDDCVNNNISEEQKEKSFDDLFGMSATMFFSKLRYLKPLGKKVKLGGFVRAVKHAFLATISEENVKLKSKAEMELAKIIAQLIDHHTIIRGAYMKEAEEEVKNKENQEGVKDGRKEEV